MNLSLNIFFWIVPWTREFASVPIAKLRRIHPRFDTDVFPILTQSLLILDLLQWLCSESHPPNIDRSRRLGAISVSIFTECILHHD